MKTTDHVSSIIMMLTHLCVVIPCFYYTCSLDWKPKDDRPFMVFLPPGASTLPEFEKILLDYRKKVRWFTYAQIAVTPCYWFLSVMGQLVLMTGSILGYFMVPYIFGRKTREALIALKKEKKWITEYTAVHRYDLRLTGKKVSSHGYRILFLLSAVFPVAYMAYAAFLKTGTVFFSELMSVLLCETFLLTAALWQRRRYRLWKNEILHPNDFCSGNEDDYWHMGKFGIYYDNPYDPAILKSNNSGGMNMNMNRARLCSWIFWVAVWAVIVLPLAYYTVYPYYIDYTGQLVDLQLSEDCSQVEIEGPFYHATIPLEGMTSIQLIDSLDELGSGVRANGTGTSIYGKGHFRYENTGPVISYTAYRHPPYILLTIQDGEEKTTYLFNDDDEKVTGEVFKELQRVRGAGPSAHPSRF